MSDISHLIRLFYLDSDEQQWRKDMADRVMAQIALLRAEHSDYKQRAEAAEARAANLAEDNREKDEAIKTLRASVTALTAQNAEQARRIEQARKAMHDVEDQDTTLSYALRCARVFIDQTETDWYRWFGVQAEAIDAWLASTAHAPQAEQEPE